MQPLLATQKPLPGTPLRLGDLSAEGLVACWTCVDAPNKLGRLHDFSNYRNHGTLVADAHSVPGKFGPALYFDGTGDYVDCGRPSSLLISTEVTYSVVFMISTVAVNKNVFQNAEDWNRNSLRITDTDSYIYLKEWRASVGTHYTWVDGSTFVSPNVWHNITIVLNPAEGYAKTYLDGVEVDTQAIATNTVWNYEGDGKFLIGGTAASGDGPAPDSYFPGYIDNLMVWARALSPSEVPLNLQKPYRMFVPEWMSVFELASQSAAPAGIPLFRRRRAG